MVLLLNVGWSSVTLVGNIVALTGTSVSMSAFMLNVLNQCDIRILTLWHCMV